MRVEIAKISVQKCIFQAKPFKLKNQLLPTNRRKPVAIWRILGWASWFYGITTAGL